MNQLIKFRILYLLNEGENNVSRRARNYKLLYRKGHQFIGKNNLVSIITIVN